ncbi:MAG: dinitrogenase iron-molybdenum cofactor biosynthesis protein [Bacteroidetes bacterium 4572_114]|nr:MAG: dinitrogenase iron-molybdenum cofactor biosynthesis protein [Bacteroidetes bacterium 4572_114]
MKIAFTTKGKTWDSPMDPRFGRTEYFLIYDEEKEELTHYDNRDSANEAHGAGPKTAQKLFEFNPDILITGNGPGGNAAAVLEKTGIKILVGAGDMTVKEAYNAYKKGEL